MNWLPYPAILIILVGALLVYFRLARRYNILDVPGERSSHTLPTLRGGGIIFPLAFILWYLFIDRSQPIFLVALLLISLVSFIDDLYTLSGSIRMLVQLLAVSLMMWYAGIFGMHPLVIPLAYILIIGWINAFNFMDGINGITPLYALTALLTFLLLNNTGKLLPLVTDLPAGIEGWEFLPNSLLIVMTISVGIFTYYNARKRARIFAGDVGSVGMAFLLAWLMVSLMLKTATFWWILLFAVYGVDTVSTIIIRLSRGENIFKPHRQHLYQLMTNGLGWPHLKVAGLYATIQFLFNGLTIGLYFTGQLNLGTASIVTATLLAGYIAIRFSVHRQLYSKG